MKLKRFLSIASMGLALTTLVGCGKNKKALYVAYFDGGYGGDWLETFIKEYLAEEKGTSVDNIKKDKDYRLVPDADITYSAGNYVKSKRDCPDLLITNNLDSSLVKDGYIAGLSDVFDAEIEKMDGSKVKIKDYVDVSCSGRYRYEKRYGNEATMDYWALPWTAIPCSIAYNETLLNKVTHYNKNGTVVGLNDGDKWSTVPATIEETLTYFADIDDYNTANGTSISKFGWAGKDGTSWFEFMTMTWFAQLHGTGSGNLAPGKYASEGVYDDFWKLEASVETAENYKWTGIQKALTGVKRLITQENDGDGIYINSVKNADAIDIKDLQTMFADGKIAMCLTGDWFEHEYSSVLKESGQTIKTMFVPSIEEAVRTADYTRTAKITYLTTDNVMFIPTGAKHMDQAKGLLKYMTNEKQCLRFTQETGGIRPFDYNPVELTNKYEPDYKWTDWQKSVFDIYYGADERISKFPTSSYKAGNRLSPVYIYENSDIKTLTIGVQYSTVVDKLRKYSAADLMINGFDNNVENAVYQHALTSYKIFESRYEI